MMQRSHLTAWQAFAPWPKQSQIEQDLRLSRGVAAIFADPVLNEHLAMRGGTVLHKAHLAPAARYSEDIDLVLVKPMKPEVLDKHLRHVLAPVLGQPADSLIADAWLAIRNVLRPSQILRTVYRFVPLGLRREEIIKVEINLNESAGLYPLVDVEIDTLFVHGCFWHQHRRCRKGSMPQSNTEFWCSKLQRNVQRDAENLVALKAIGWKVLVIWECETNDESQIEKKLQRFLGN